MELHAQVSLSPGKSFQYPLKRRLGGPRAGLDALEKGNIIRILRVN
jgi:hypothetical protein